MFSYPVRENGVYAFCGCPWRIGSQAASGVSNIPRQCVCQVKFFITAGLLSRFRDSLAWILSAA